MKQITSFLLVILLCMFSTKGLAHDIEVANNDGVTIYYNYTNNKTELSVTYKGTQVSSKVYSGDVIIPESVIYNDRTYRVTSIGRFAFNGCKELTSVDIPNSVTSIEESAFAYCTSLSSTIMPNYLTSIGKSAFVGCSTLTSITIPSSTTSIGDTPFSDCSSLNSIIVDPANNRYKSESGVLFNKSGILLICYPAGKPEKKYVIPNSVKNIGPFAFDGCASLTSVDIPNSVISIREYAFSRCTGLTSVVIPNSVTSIRKFTFSGCTGLTSVDIPNSVTIIGDIAFSECEKLSSVDIPNSVISIGEYAFFSCTSLTSIVIPNSVTRISNGTFALCEGLVNIEIPNSITHIGREAFRKCSFSEIDLPDSITYIGDNAFSGCLELRKVISFIDTPFHLNNNVFENDTYQKGTLYVPEGKKEVYSRFDGWRSFINIVEMTPPTYTLSYVVDDELYKQYDLREGDEIIPEPAPVKDGFVFSGWTNLPEIMPAHNVTATGRMIPIQYYSLTIQDTESGFTRLTIKEGEQMTLTFNAEEGWYIHSITFNDRNVTDLLTNNSFTTPAITVDSKLRVVYEREQSYVKPVGSASKPQILATEEGLIIKGAAGETYQVFTTDGKMLKSNHTNIHSEEIKVNLPKGQTYLVKVGGLTIKVAL